VYTLAWSLNGTRLATGGKNGLIQLWNAITGKPVWLLHLYDQLASRKIILTWCKRIERRGEEENSWQMGNLSDTKAP
jgi:hypothetical protein